LNLLRRVFGAAVVATAAVAAWPCAASAATDTRVRLEYDAPEQGCMGEDDLRRMVTGQLGHDPFRPDADQRVAISIVKTDPGFQARIIWTEADGRPVGQRILSSRSRDCREIAANVAFAVALQLQLIERGGASDAGAPVPNTEQTPPASSGQSERADGADHAEGAERPPADEERPSVSPGAAAGAAAASPAPLALAIGAGPAVGVGMAPEAAAFGRLFFVARVRQLSAEIAADAALPVTLREPDGSGVVVNAVGSSAAGCAHVSVASACLLGRLGGIRARGTGIASPRTSWGWFGEVGMRLAGNWELGRFIVSVHADGLVMLSRWNVKLNDFPVWSVPRVGGVMGLDVALRFF
jgi:hypothetical protein